jgi:transposase
MAYIAQSLKGWAKEKFDATVRIAKNLAMKFKKFVPVSQRWVVERTFSWLYDFRRLAAISLMLNRLAPNELVAEW